MCGHQHTKSQTSFACRHLLKLCTCGIISIPKFFVYFLMSEISCSMFKPQSEESSEIRFLDIQISALVTESVIKCSHLTFFTRKSHSGWEMMRPLWFHCFLPHISTWRHPTHPFYLLFTIQVLLSRQPYSFFSWCCVMCSALSYLTVL